VRFEDARRLDDGTTIAVDLCIVGAGAAGIALACACAGRPFRVLLLESGGLSFAHRPQLLYIGDNVGTDNYAPSHSRFRMFGGSTTRWGGQCRPLDAIDFEPRAGIAHSGWPFDLAHLAPWYRRAHRVCRLGLESWQPADFASNETPALPIAGREIETVIYQFSHPSDFGQVHRAELEAAANVDILLQANLVEIEADADARNVTGLALATFNGRRLRVTARAYVLACGGIENARLLLASNRVAAAGLGNGHDLVGRFFMDHPYFLTGHLEPAQPRYDRSLHVIEGYEGVGWRQRAHAAFALSEEVRRAEQLNGCAGYLIRRPDYKTRPEYFSPGGKSLIHLVDVMSHAAVPDRHFGRHLAQALRGWRDIKITLARQLRERVRPRPRLALRSVVEQTPRRDSRVMLGQRRDRFGLPRVRVDWRLNASDRRGLDRLRAALAAELERRGLGRLVDDPAEDEAGWPCSMSGGKHHMGTTRMHADPHQGVVDPDCRVHGLANLYVAGSSLFPTSGYANPTLTIVALALRLADHLKIRLTTPPLR
jgi:choline dehydrogenase-like flavoprotein